MISIDTNIFVYAQNADSPQHRKAFNFITACGQREDVVLCELVLVEVYLVLRSPAVLPRPLSAEQAAEMCLTYRRNPRWRLAECAPVMDDVWGKAGDPGFARRGIIDARLALTLRRHGVDEFATANVKDFGDFGFRRVWDPLV